MPRTLHQVLSLSLLLFLSCRIAEGNNSAASDTLEKDNLPTGVIEKGGNFLPLDAIFKNETGDSISLRQLITKPTLLLPVYYNCPRICSFDMANLALALQQTSIPHDSFEVITLSFDEHEKPEDAARAKTNYTTMLSDSFSTDSWHFLTGDPHNINLVTDSIGYTFKPAGEGLFLHPSALVAIGRDGKIIKYVYGSFLSGDVDLALSEAEKGTPATSIRRFLAYCLNNSPERNKTIFLILKTSILLLIAIGGFFLARLLLKGRQ